MYVKWYIGGWFVRRLDETRDKETKKRSKSNKRSLWPEFTAVAATSVSVVIWDYLLKTSFIPSPAFRELLPTNNTMLVRPCNVFSTSSYRRHQHDPCWTELMLLIRTIYLG